MHEVEGNVGYSKCLHSTGWWLQNHNSHLASSFNGHDFALLASMDFHVHLCWNHPSLALHSGGLEGYANLGYGMDLLLARASTRCTSDHIHHQKCFWHFLLPIFF